MQANQGKVEVQAQNDELQLNALKDATLTSSAGKITIAAKEEILITCKGAYIKLANGEVEIGSPKVVRVRAPLVVTGPSYNRASLPIFNSPFRRRFLFEDEEGRPYAFKRYMARWKDGYQTFGVTDENGNTEVFITDESEDIYVHLLEKGVDDE